MDQIENLKNNNNKSARIAKDDDYDSTSLKLCCYPGERDEWSNVRFIHSGAIKGLCQNTSQWCPSSSSSFFHSLLLLFFF